MRIDQISSTKNSTKKVIQALLTAAVLVSASTGQEPAERPDGLYAEITTSKGLIVARLEADLAPMTVANFVGLAEGTIANSAFDPGRPFFDGSVYHRVVPGHVIQAGIPKSDRAKGPGYTFPNEINAKLSHNHAGALNMANSGPNTNSSQFCVTLADRSYLDGNFTVFGEVVQGLDVVMKIVQGDVIQSVRILRVGRTAQAFHPTTESFQQLVRSAQQRVMEQTERKRIVEREWIAKNYPNASGPADGVLTQELAPGQPSGGGPLRVRYRGRELHYVGDVTGRDGPLLDPVSFGSNETGLPAFVETPAVFTVEPGKTKLNAGLDGIIATMLPGERRIAIVPAPLAYGRAGFYAPEIPGKRRLVISPNSMLAYEIEILKPE
jgi:peptidylprolyl isomerase